MKSRLFSGTLAPIISIVCPHTGAVLDGVQGLAPASRVAASVNISRTG